MNVADLRIIYPKIHKTFEEVFSNDKGEKTFRQKVEVSEDLYRYWLETLEDIDLDTAKKQLKRRCRGADVVKIVVNELLAHEIIQKTKKGYSFRKFTDALCSHIEPLKIECVEETPMHLSDDDVKDLKSRQPEKYQKCLRRGMWWKFYQLTHGIAVTKPDYYIVLDAYYAVQKEEQVYKNIKNKTTKTQSDKSNIEDDKEGVQETSDFFCSSFTDDEAPF